MKKEDNFSYSTWGLIIGFISFVIIWICAITAWGGLIGLALGWIPALIGGLILGFLWPIPAFAVLIGVFVLLSNSH